MRVLLGSAEALGTECRLPGGASFSATLANMGVSTMPGAMVRTRNAVLGQVPGRG